MALIDDFKTRFPEFEADKVDELLPTFEGVWQCYYGGDYSRKCEREIILNLLAHLFVEASSTSVEGTKETASETVGNVSVSYVSGAASGGMNRLWPYFGSTKYGKQFLFLINRFSGAKFV